MKQAGSLVVEADRLFRAPRKRGRQRPLSPLVGFSLLLHLALLVLVLITMPERTPPEPLPPPGVAMVFEGGSQTGATVPEPTPFTSTPPPTPEPQAPAPEAATPEVPAPAPPPAVPVPPVPPPVVPESRPPTPATSPQPAPSQAAPAPPLPAPTPPLPPPVASPVVPPLPVPASPLGTPTLPLPAPTPPPVAPAPAPLAVPAPPPPALVRPVEPRRPPPPPHPATPRPPRAESPFSAPMNLSFGNPGRPADTPSPPADHSLSGRQPVGLALGPLARGGIDIEPLSHGRSPGPDWRNLLAAWIEAHKYYPPQAAANGEDGTVVVRVVVDRYGAVQTVQLESRSGSQWLDLAAQAMFRGAHLPPFPADMTDPDFTFNLTMHYILIRR